MTCCFTLNPPPPPPFVVHTLSIEMEMYISTYVRTHVDLSAIACFISLKVECVYIYIKIKIFFFKRLIYIQLLLSGLVWFCFWLRFVGEIELFYFFCFFFVFCFLDFQDFKNLIYFSY